MSVRFWLLAFSILLFTAIDVVAQVRIGNDVKEPDSSAMLEIDSRSRGFLPPRMNTGQRDSISGPAEGLVIFNTDIGCLEVFSSQWVSLCFDKDTLEDDNQDKGTYPDQHLVHYFSPELDNPAIDPIQRYVFVRSEADGAIQDGRKWQTAYRSVTAAINALEPGQELLIFRGKYQVSNLELPKNPGALIRLKGVEDSVIFFSDGVNANIFADTLFNIEFSGIKFIIEQSGSVVEYFRDTRWFNCEFSHKSGSLSFAGAADFAFNRNNEFEHCTFYSVQDLLGNAKVLINSCTFYTPQQWSGDGIVRLTNSLILGKESYSLPPANLTTESEWLFNNIIDSNFVSSILNSGMSFNSGDWGYNLLVTADSLLFLDTLDLSGWSTLNDSLNRTLRNWVYAGSNEHHSPAYGSTWMQKVSYPRLNLERRVLDIRSSDKIAFVGDSQWSGEYNYLGANPLQRISDKTDFIISNHSASGVVLGDWPKLYLGNRVGGLSSRYLPSYGNTAQLAAWEVNPTYVGMPSFFGNDISSYQGIEEPAQYYAKVFTAIRADGAIPFIVTPPGQNIALNTMSQDVDRIEQVALKYGVESYNAYDYITNITHYKDSTWTDYGGTWIRPMKVFRQFYGVWTGGYHQNSLGNRVWADWFIRNFTHDAESSLKIFRADSIVISGLSSSDQLDALRFCDREDLNRSWNELHFGQYFGNIGRFGIHNYKQSIKDEYHTLMLGNAVEVKEAIALLKFKVPYTEIFGAELVIPTPDTLDVFIADWSFVQQPSYLLSPDTTCMRWKHIARVYGGTALKLNDRNIDDSQFKLSHGDFLPLNGGNLYILLKASGSSISLHGSPQLIYQADPSRKLPPAKRSVYIPSAPALYSPYFSYEELRSWNSLGCDTLNAHTSSWSYPDDGETLSYILGTPMECDDTVLLIGDGDTLYRAIDISGLTKDTYLEIEVIGRAVITDNSRPDIMGVLYEVPLNLNLSVCDRNGDDPLNGGSTFRDDLPKSFSKDIPVIGVWQDFQWQVRLPINRYSGYNSMGSSLEEFLVWVTCDTVYLTLTKANPGSDDIQVAKVSVTPVKKIIFTK